VTQMPVCPSGERTFYSSGDGYVDWAVGMQSIGLGIVTGRIWTGAGKENGSSYPAFLVLVSTDCPWPRHEMLHTAQERASGKLVKAWYQSFSTRTVCVLNISCLIDSSLVR
jgi:hypothetical protein